VKNTDYGLVAVGAQSGQPFEQELSFADSIDFYVDLVNRFGPVQDCGAYHLAEPAQQIRYLWIAAKPSERRQRPHAIELARLAWVHDLEKLESGATKRSMWNVVRGALDSDAKAIAADSIEYRSRLNAVREPPPLPPELVEEEARKKAESIAYWKEHMSKLKLWISITLTNALYAIFITESEVNLERHAVKQARKFSCKAL
jgi:hypothetical protein